LVLAAPDKPLITRIALDMPPKSELEPLLAIATHERATPSLVYRSLLRSLHEGHIQPGAKLPNERDIARQLKTSRTAVRAALSMMERQGLIRRRVGSGTFVTEDAEQVFEKMDQTSAAPHNDVPSFTEIVEGRLLFEPAMMQIVVNRVEPAEIEAMRATLDRILNAPTWREFKERIYSLHQLMFAATTNRFLIQIMDNIVADRRAVVFDGKDTDTPAPFPVRQQTHKELAAIVEAISRRRAKRAQELTGDHLMRMLATINIWQ
jgi:DNA-binding FadR family transcriptional regulator